MGLFGKLFDKKNCDICGGEIGLLGNKKLEDGNLCKTCAAKLSPWFSERRHSTVETIRAHLAYREENQTVLAGFQPTRTLGNYTKLYIDEKNRTFIATSDKNWREKNPDVVPMDRIADVTVDVHESRTELKQERKTPDGKTEKISFNPPRYKYMYSFTLKILMQEAFEWFDAISFGLNDGEISIDSYNAPVTPRTPFGKALTGLDPHISLKYCEAERLGEEIRQFLLAGRESAASAPAPEVAGNASACAYCSSPLTPGAKFCTSCGAPV